MRPGAFRSLTHAVIRNGAIVRILFGEIQNLVAGESWKNHYGQSSKKEASTEERDATQCVMSREYPEYVYPCSTHAKADINFMKFVPKLSHNIRLLS